ncbi:MAG: DUF4870 domain-containing protein [Burkholderiaceae bacterium]|nr:DUF4870 domain-containing protein [Burkholderiaceae bacterium]
MNDVVTTAPSKDDSTMAMLAHLLGFVLSFIPSLVIWLIKKDESPFVAQEAKEALNFQITLVIGHAIAMALTIIAIGAFLFPLLWILNIVFCIIAAVTASKGQAYRYPFTLRLVK